ncbi:unnamed protein product [Ranitomeya imitator]|uniref:Transposase n=1 Tax=Ranitomeya imitator TaxID=111125 RepID=A0ABN9LED9_9NEOB|nr:unnamed protein product [Ranitomeya imitator]
MSSAGVGPLCFIRTKVSAAIYQDILEHFMLPSADMLFGDGNFILQQDLAPVHTVKSTNTWFKSNYITVLDWPANLSDLNPIDMGYCQEEDKRDTRPNNIFNKSVENLNGKSPELLRSEGSFSIEGRHSSTDSNKASSGDVSPYDNNSPVLSDRSATARQENSSEKILKAADHQTLVSHLLSKTKENASAQWCPKDTIPQESLDIWGTWHSTLKSVSKDQGMTGSYGNIYESSSLHQGPYSLSQNMHKLVYVL